MTRICPHDIILIPNRERAKFLIDTIHPSPVGENSKGFDFRPVSNTVLAVISSMHTPNAMLLYTGVRCTSIILENGLFTTRVPHNVLDDDATNIKYGYF